MTRDRVIVWTLALLAVSGAADAATAAFDVSSGRPMELLFGEAGLIRPSDRYLKTFLIWRLSLKEEVDG